MRENFLTSREAVNSWRRKIRPIDMIVTDQPANADATTRTVILWAQTTGPSSSSSSSIGTTAHCGLWPVEQYPSIFSYLPRTLSIFSLPALEDLFLLPLSIFSWVFPFFSFLPVHKWRSFWAPYPLDVINYMKLLFALFHNSTHVRSVTKAQDSVIELLKTAFIIKLTCTNFGEQCVIAV